MKNDIQENTLRPQLWAKLHTRHLMRIASAAVNNPQQARDLVQDTYLAALESLDKFEGRSNERTWLTAILKNKVRDFYSRQTGLDRILKNNLYSALVASEPARVDELLERKELNSIIMSSIRKLPELWSNVFTMKHLADEQTPEICRKLNISKTNYWTIMHRAKQNLRLELENITAPVAFQ